MLPDTRRRCPYFVHEDHLPMNPRKMLACGPSRPVQRFQYSFLWKPGVQIKSQQGKSGAPRQCHDHLETMQQIMSRDTSRDCCRVSLSACKRSFRSQMFCYTPSPSRTLSPSSFYLARPGDARPVHPSIHSLREGCTIAPAVLRSPGEHSNISHTALPHPRCNSTSWIVHSPQESNILTRQFTKSSRNICLDKPELQGHVTLRWTYSSLRAYTEYSFEGREYVGAGDMELHFSPL